MKLFAKSFIILFFFQCLINVASAQSSAELWNMCKEALDQGYKPEEVKACRKFNMRHYEIPHLQKTLTDIYDLNLNIILLPCKYKNCVEYPNIYPWIAESVHSLGDPNPQPSLPNDVLLESAIELQDTLKEFNIGLESYIKELEESM